jgi:hypothetical protein
MSSEEVTAPVNEDSLPEIDSDIVEIPDAQFIFGEIETPDTPGFQDVETTIDKLDAGLLDLDIEDGQFDYLESPVPGVLMESESPLENDNIQSEDYEEQEEEEKENTSEPYIKSNLKNWKNKGYMGGCS